MRTHWRHLTVLGILVCFFHPPIASAQQQGPKASPWVAWKMFYQALPGMVDKNRPTAGPNTIGDRLGLTVAQHAALVAAGQQFLTDIAAIDADTANQIKQRGYNKWTAPKNQPHTPGQRFPLPRPNYVQQAMADGLYQQQDGKANAALNKHLANLQQVFKGDSTTVPLITNFVQTHFAPVWIDPASSKRGTLPNNAPKLPAPPPPPATPTPRGGGL